MHEFVLSQRENIYKLYWITSDMPALERARHPGLPLPWHPDHRAIGGLAPQ